MQKILIVILAIAALLVLTSLTGMMPASQTAPAPAPSGSTPDPKPVLYRPSGNPNTEPGTPPQSADTVFDDFERTSLGPNWGTPLVVSRNTGTPGIVNGSDLGILARGSTGSPLSLVEWIADDFDADQFSEGVISRNRNADVIAQQVFVRRRESDGARYAFHFNGGVTPKRFELKYDGTAPGVPLATLESDRKPQNGDVIRIEVRGYTLVGYLNGEEILRTTVTNPAYQISWGRPGTTAIITVRQEDPASPSLPQPLFESWRGGDL